MSKVTRKNVADYLNISIDYIKQVDSKQLFIVNVSNDLKLLVSYTTIVGFKHQTIWHITMEKFSATTSRQVNQFTRKLAENSLVYLDTDTFIKARSRIFKLNFKL